MKPTKNSNVSPSEALYAPSVTVTTAYSKPSKSSRNLLWGFTLVELIVVITILAILATIGFLAIGGYSSKARDSARLWDIAQIAKSLDLSVITAGTYPVPDNSFAVTYSGGTVWNQWTVGPLVIQYFDGTIKGGGLAKKPVDPLRNTEYVYSSLAFWSAYQLKAECENDIANPTAYGQAVDRKVAYGQDQTKYEIQYGNFLLPAASADAGNPTIAYIRGNYGWLVAKTVTGSTTYVIAIPSIITNSGTVANGTLLIESNALSGNLLFNGKPLLNASTYNPNARANSGVVFSGTGGLPGSDATGQITNMMVALKSAYSGSDIVSNANVANLLSATGTVAIQSLGTAIVTGQLGGKATTGGGGGTPAGNAFACGTSSVVDADANSYATVQIGTQCWMKTNLRTTKNPDGSAITKGNPIDGGGGWATDVKQYSCPPNVSNDGEDCAAATTYGMLYQWSAAMNGSTADGAQGICPSGWHVPTDAEYMALEEYLGMCSGAWVGCSGEAAADRGTVQGSKLGGGSDWLDSTDGLRQNESDITRPEFGTSGFDAQPSGYRGTGGNFSARFYGTYFWSSTQVDASSAWQRILNYSMPSVYRGYGDTKENGYSLRCVQG